LWIVDGDGRDFADEFPSAEVIGTDLSPIQPSFVAPNCKFEVDDACVEWTYAPDSFDFVHVRALYGSVADWPAFYTEAFKYAHSKSSLTPHKYPNLI
jgi:hypothetical protein